jgi:hypothetical protein
MAPRWAPPAGLLLLVLLLAPAVSGDKPLRGGGPSGSGGAKEPEPSSAVFPLYGDVYPHGYVRPPPSSSLPLFPPIPPSARLG